MGIPYERIVKEDLNLGVGSVAVSMPAGGTATGTKLGTHTWLGMVSVLNEGAAGDGNQDDRFAFAAADALNLGTYVPPGTYRIASTLTIAGAIWFAPGAVLSVPTGVTVTLNGAVTAGWGSPIFSVAGTGAIAFGQGAVERLSPVWFGADPTGTADSTTAFQALIAALPTTTSNRFGGYIWLGTFARFKVTDTLTFPSTKIYRVSGGGMRTTILDWWGGNNKPVLSLQTNAFGAGAGPQWGVELDHFAIENGGGSTGCNAVAYDYSGSNGNDFIMAKIESVMIYAGTGRWNACVYAHGAMSLELDRLYGSGSVYGFLHETPSYELESFLMRGCEWTDWTHTAVIIDGVSQGTIRNCEFQQNQDGAKVLSIDRLDAFTFKDNLVEFAGGHANLVAMHFGTTARGPSSLSGLRVVGNHLNMGSAASGSVMLKIDHVGGAEVNANVFALVETAISVTANADDVLIGPQSWGTGVTTHVVDALTAIGGRCMVLDGTTGHQGVESTTGHFQDTAPTTFVEPATFMHRGQATILDGQTYIDVTWTPSFSQATRIAVGAHSMETVEAIKPDYTTLGGNGCRFTRADDGFQKKESSGSGNLRIAWWAVGEKAAAGAVV